MTEKNSSPSDIDLAKALEARVVDENPGPSEVDHVFAICVRDALTDALGDGSDLTAGIGQLCKGTIGATKKLGVPIWHAARGAVIGLYAAGHPAGIDLTEAIRTAAAVLMQESDKIGGDFGAVAKGVVEGAIEGADLFGLEWRGPASVAANAALVTAKELGEGAIEHVHHLVTGRIHSVPVSIDRANSVP